MGFWTSLDQRRLADARVSADREHQLAAGGGGRECIEECGQLCSASVELFGHHELLESVCAGERKFLDPIRSTILAQATLEIGDQAGCALVAVLGILGQQLVDDARDLRGNASVEFAQCRRNQRDVSVHQRQRIGQLKRSVARQRMIEGCTE